MSNPTWASVGATAGGPELQLSGNSRQWPKNIIATAMDVGPKKMRRRSADAPTPMSFTCIVDESDRDDLYTFYHSSCADGALVFDLVDPYVGGTVEVRWVSPPVETKRFHDSYLITLNWEKMP